MDYSEIVKLIYTLGVFGVGTLLGGGIIYLFIKSYLPSYLSEKAKNLASKEDIEFITGRVESVKLDYTRLLEEIRSDNQLKFAAIDREKSIKKEVYMEAVESITRSLNMITGFSNLNLSEEQITSSFNHDSGKIAKIQIVGGKETVKAVTTFMAEIGKSILDLMLKRSDLTTRKHLIHMHESSLNKVQQEIDKYIEIMKNINLQGSTDQTLWEIVNRNVVDEQELYDATHSKLQELWAIQNSELIEYGMECTKKFFDASLLLPIIVLAIRDELNLEISREDYCDIFYGNIEEGRTVFQDFMSRVQRDNSCDN